MMGVCISGMVRCCTDMHDRYLDHQWRDLDENDLAQITHLQTATAPAPPRSIHVAVVNKSEEDIRRILAEDQSAAIEENASGETPLHQACRLGYVHIVHVLLNNGCPADITTDQGTAFHCVIKAAQSGYTNTHYSIELIQLLADAGCKVNGLDRGRKTPLFCAVEQGNLPAAQKLVSLGADVNLAENNSFTPLYMAVIRGDLNVVQFLLGCPQVNINAEDDAGRTPLVASLISITNNFRYGIAQIQKTVDRYDRIAIAEALLAAGADPTVVDNQDRTALVIAFAMLERDCISRTQGALLNSHTGNVDTVDPVGLSESVYVPLVRLLVLAGAYFPESFEKDYSKGPLWIRKLYKESQKAWLMDIVQKPSKLVHLCRISVRQHLASIGKLQQITEVPVPNNLKRYLQVDYI